MVIVTVVHQMVHVYPRETLDSEPLSLSIGQPFSSSRAGHVPKKSLVFIIIVITCGKLKIYYNGLIIHHKVVISSTDDYLSFFCDINLG